MTLCPTCGTALASTPETAKDRADRRIAELDVNALADTVANIRQGQSDTPRCELPSVFDIEVARKWTVWVLKAIEEHDRRAGIKARGDIEPRVKEPDFASSIAALFEEERETGSAFGWRACSGCHETNEGAETGHYPYSKMFGSFVGSGCTECGGLGVVWEYWSAHAFESMQEHDIKPPQSPELPETYYSKGKDAEWIEGLSNKDFAWALTCAAQDLNDSDENVSAWMPVSAFLSDAAERIEALDKIQPPQSSGERAGDEGSRLFRMLDWEERGGAFHAESALGLACVDQNGDGFYALENGRLHSDFATAEAAQAFIQKNHERWVQDWLMPSALARPAEGWRPMESAPKDGTKIDVWVKPHDAEANGKACRITDVWFSNGKWKRWLAGWEHDVDECGTPVAWMPKPKAPAPDQEGGDNG